jgi:NAD(P)-dependent dehydrogenase (short-subunit alcohol dehydrogenase family)
MAERVQRSIGTVDALVNCAGIASRGTALEIEPEAWDRVLAVNLRGTWLCSRAVLPGMIDQGRGSIVNISSISALIGTRATAAYAASKAGVLGLTRQMAVDFGTSGVRVNAVCPGTVDTPLSRGRWVAAGLDEEAIDERKAATANRTAVGRAGQPDDIASMVLFLVGPDSTWITGCSYTVDGGTVTTRTW